MTITPKIFKIDKSHRLLKDISSTKKILQFIIRTSYAKFGWSIKSDSLDFRQFDKEGMTYFLYLYSSEDQPSEWATFLPQELQDDPELFMQTKLSLLLFVQTEHDLYVVIGGNAYPIVVNFIDHDFGLDVYDRIISLDNDEAYSTKSRRIIGHQAGLSEQFRDRYKIINYLQFGKIPKELNIKLALDTSRQHFGFLLSKPTDRLKITAGKSFRISKEVDFDTLDRIIRELCTINELAPQELLSSYTEVKDARITDTLEIQLNNRIYNYVPLLLRTETTMLEHFEFDLCSPNNIEAFYTAESYQLKEKVEDGHATFATLTDKDEIFRTVVLRAYATSGDNETAFLFYLRGVRVNCYQGTTFKTGSTFLYHINAEFNNNGVPIFLIDTKWYRLKDAFVKSLERQTATIFKNTRLTAGIMDLPWDLKSSSSHLIDEGDYNMQYDGRPDFFVLDTITPDGVELCDIIHFTDSEIYMIHVKHSFTARVRELTNQILLSARRLSEAISAKNQVFFNKLHSSMLSKGRATNNLSNEQFAQLFYDKNPVYVFATASQFADDPLISDNIDRYASNIARFSVTTCASEIRTSYGDFKTCQIRRS